MNMLFIKTEINMIKKVVTLWILIASMIATGNDAVSIIFKNGASIDYSAESYWTYFLHCHDYYKFFSNTAGCSEKQYDTSYVCLNDYSCMNSVSREAKRGDYKNLRDRIQATGNEANYFEKNGTVTDSWCLSLPYSQIEKFTTYCYGELRVIYNNGKKEY